MVTAHVYHAYIVALIASTLTISGSRERVIIFIHGTIGIELGIFCDLRHAWRDTFTGSTLTERVCSLIRNDALWWMSDVMLQEGLVQIPLNHLAYPLAPDVSHYGAYHVAATFHELRRPMDAICSYYTFGWSGLLSRTERRKAGEQLYQALRQLVMLQLHGEDPIIELHGHSHGGQIILQLPEVARHYGDDSMHINLATLSGTPLHRDNAAAISSPMFATLINCYSKGDGVQTLDIITTPHHRAYRTLGEVARQHMHTSPRRRIDVQLGICGRWGLLGHHAFFLIDRYPHQLIPSHAQQCLKALGPIPLVSLYDSLLAAHADLPNTYHHMRLSLELSHGSLVAKYAPLHGNTKHTITRWVATTEQLHMLRERIVQSYHPTRFPSEFTKFMRTCKMAWSHARHRMPTA